MTSGRYIIRNWRYSTATLLNTNKIRLLSIKVNRNSLDKNHDSYKIINYYVRNRRYIVSIDRAVW